MHKTIDIKINRFEVGIEWMLDLSKAREKLGRAYPTPIPGGDDGSLTQTIKVTAARY